MIVYLRGHEGRGHRHRPQDPGLPACRTRATTPSTPTSRSACPSTAASTASAPRSSSTWASPRCGSSPTTRPSTAASRASGSRSSSGCRSITAPNPENIAYLRTKRERMGHLLEGLDDVLELLARPRPARRTRHGRGNGTGRGARRARRRRAAGRGRAGPLQRAHHRPAARRRARAGSALGVVADDVVEVWVPGAFEIPFAARTLAASGGVDAVICLGAVIRGETTHYDFVAGECASGIQQAQLATGVPIVFGVLTAENLDQALARSEGRRPQRGRGGRGRSPSRWPRIAAAHPPWAEPPAAARRGSAWAPSAAAGDARQDTTAEAVPPTDPASRRVDRRRPAAAGAERHGRCHDRRDRIAAAAIARAR